MSDYNELLKTIDDALAQTDKAQEPKNPTQAILDEIDAALGEKPEAAPEPPAPVPSVTPAPVPSVTPTPVESVPPAPVPSVTPQPEAAVTPAPVAAPQPSPTPSPVSQPVAELPKPSPSRLPEPTPPKEPEVDYSLPSNQFLAMVNDIPDEKWGKDEVNFLNTLSGKDLSEIKKQRPDVIWDDILNQKMFDYQRATTPYKIPENKEDFYNLTKASATFLGRDIPVMASELVGDVLVGGAKAVKQGVPELLGFNSTYSKALQGLELLSPEKKKEVLDWQTQAFFILNTPLKGGEKPNPNSYTDDLFLKKVQEGLSKEQIQALDQKYEQKRMEAKQVPFETLAPLADLPPSLAFLGTKLATGGFQTWDSISEQAGLLSKEQAYERWKTRELLDSVKAKMAKEEPRAWARAMDIYKPIYADEVKLGPVYLPTLSYFASLSTPSVQEMMIMDPKLTKEEAESKRKATIEANVLDSIEETKKSIPETDPELQAFGDVAIPGGFGLDTFGYALNVVNASKMLTPIARLKLKKLRYTDDEINALESKAQRILKEKQLKELESKKTAGLVERAAGATAKGIEATGEYLERSPKFQTIARYTPYVAGAALGYEINPENPLQSLVVGGITTKLGLKGAEFGAKTLLQAPKVIKEISAARRISAGGEMGPLATLKSIAKQQDEVKNLTAKLKTLSEGTEEYIDTKKLLDDAKDKAKGIKEAGGEVVDYEGIGKVSDTTKNILRFASDDLISNIGEYAKMGIEPTILGLSMGMIDSSDEEELKGMIGSGLVFSLGGRAMQQGFHKFLGEDPVIAERKSRQASMDALKAYRDSSPETQGEIDRLTDWTNVLQRQENKIGQAQIDLQGLQAEGAIPDKIKKAEKVLSAEQKSLSLLKTANVQTRNEFGKNFLQQLARNNMLINGSLKAGQNNVGFHILSTQQIFDHFRKKPEYRDVSDEDLMMSATQQGFYSGTGGNEYRPSMEVSDAAKGLVFDTSKPSIVVNSDALQNRMMIFGETPTEALNHETGHHFARIPEIQNAMGDARKVLFTNEIKDASGAVKEISNGLYSEKQLNEMFVKDYIKNRLKDQVAEIAKNLGVWDYNTNSLNAKDVGSYMQEEILAELFSNTLSRNLGKNLDSKQLHLLDVARFKMKNNLLKNAVTKVLGLGASSDVVSELTNAKLPPEAQSAARNAVRLIQSMNGDFSTMASMPQAAPISKAEIKKSKIAAERYGMDSGLFATKVVAQVFDADGNPVGAAVDVNDPSVYEGSWRISKDGEERLSGYGQIPVQLRQLQVPEGGTLSIAKQVATEVDGVTPRLLKPEEVKKLQKDRATLFKQAIDTPDYGTPGRFEAVSEGSETYRGAFTPMQIKALQDLPEGIVPLKIKKYLLDLNEAIVKKDGTRFYMDYASVMDDKGNYKAFSPKIYDVVPIGLQLSTKGNFLVTTISVGRLMEKLNLWSDRMPNRLNPWGGSKEAFWADFSKKYLDNWTNKIEGSGYDKNGQPIGTNQLDTDVQQAEIKKSILNDFLNLATNETRDLNLDRTITPRRKGDPKNKNLDRTIGSMRIDHIAELLNADHLPKLPIDYGKALINFMPEDPIEATETKRYPTSERGMYSGLQKTIDQKVQGKFASPDQLKAIVTNPQNAKAEELKWSGVLGEIDRLAAENQGKVPKDKVMDYLRNEGAVKFEEVTLGQDNSIKKIADEYRIKIEDEYGEKAFYDEFDEPIEFDELPIRLQDAMYQSKNVLEPKHSTYQLPGGTNYREVVMTMPIPKEKASYEVIQKGDLYYPTDIVRNISQFPYPTFDQANAQVDMLNKTAGERTSKESYTSSHFPNTPNYVAHMRLNERTDAQGNEGLFVEELQSDRHQAGREKGYIQDVQIDENRIFDDNGVFRVKGVYDPSVKFKTKGDALEYIKSITLHGRDLIPDAPFRKDWSIQLFKRALRDAVDADKKWIGWTTGIEQVKRYEQAMRQAVDEITWDTPKGYQKAFAAIKNGNTVLAGKIKEDGSVYDSATADANGKQLSEVLGKEVASKILAENSGTATGDDLTVGGEGMKGFYDQILPKEIGKYVAKMGGKVEKSEIGQEITEDDLDMGDLSDATPQELAELEATGKVVGNTVPIWRVDITPEMAGKVRGGQLQFMPADSENIKYSNPPSEKQAIDALSSNKRNFFGMHRDLEDGYPVGLRIDIPAFTSKGVYVVTVHEKKKGAERGSVGDRIGYDTIAKVDNPIFFSNEVGAKKIKSGESNKFPVATVEGQFNSSREIPQDINEWTPVGYNPKDHSYFYDKTNEEPVLSGDEAISVGNTVFVKNPVYGNKANFAFMPEQPTEYEPISARIRPLEGISAPTKVVGAKALSLGEIEPPARSKAMLPDMELKPDISEKGIQSSDITGLQFMPAEGEVKSDIPVAKTDTEEESSDNKLISTGVDVPESVDEQSNISNALTIANSQSWKKGRDFKLDIQNRVLEAAKKAGVQISERTAEAIEYLARVGLKDGLLALDQNPNAIGWYDEKTKQALGVMSLMFPEIETDPNARFAFTWGLAVTSNGLKVDKNFELAERVYREFRKTGKMPTNIEAGQAQKAINEGLDLFNKLTKDWGVENTRKFMQTDFTVGEISRLSKDLSPGGEFADTNVRGSAILGPKIGNGFFSNLYGMFDALTMDRWLVRTWGRWTGTLVEFNPELTELAKNRLQQTIDNLTPEDKARMDTMLKNDISQMGLEYLSVAIQKASMKPEMRQLMNTTATGEEFRKAGNGYAKYMDGQKEAPSGPTERNFIREIFGLMLDELKSYPKYKDLTMADLQAVLWYAEKRLYETAKIKSDQDSLDSSDADGYEDDDAPDYANAAIAVARKKGVSEKKIQQVLENIKNDRTTTTRPEVIEGNQPESEQQKSAGGFVGKEKQKFKQYVAVTTARRNRTGNEEALWTYARKSGSDSGELRVLKPKSKKNLGVKYISEWKPGRKLATMFRNNELPPVKFLELDSTDKASAQKFADTLQQSKESSLHGASVYVYPAEDYQGMNLFLSDSGKSGFAVKPDGDIVSVFSMEKGSGRSVMEAAIAAGGKKLDAFDTILPEFYGTHGFVEAARIPWNDEFAPDGWDKQIFSEFNNGEPDVVMMVLDPKFEGEYEPRTDVYTTEYDQAVKMQNSMLKKMEPKRK